MIEFEHITLRDAELKWFLTFLAKKRELAGFKSEMGEALINGGNLTQISGRHDVLHSELVAITSAIEAIRRRRPSVIAAEYKRQAAEARRKAKIVLEERQRLLRDTEKHLRALSQIEDVAYTHGILSAQRYGAWCASPTSGYGIDDLSPFEVGMDPGNKAPFKLPKSRRLIDEANRLELTAEELDRRPASSDGHCEAESLDALVDQVYSDPMRMGPEPFSITAWAASKEKEFLEPKPGLAIYSRRLVLQWTNGEIDDGHSFVEFTTRPRETAAA